MLVLLVRPPAGAVRERHRTVPALVRRLAGVDALVLAHQDAPGERLAAHETAERLLAGVHAHVLVEGGPLRIPAAAHLALVRLLVGAGGDGRAVRRRRLPMRRSVVLLQVVARVKGGSAHRTHARLAGGVRVRVLGQRACVRGAQAAHVAGELGGGGGGAVRGALVHFQGVIEAERLAALQAAVRRMRGADRGIGDGADGVVVVVVRVVQQVVQQVVVVVDGVVRIVWLGSAVVVDGGRRLNLFGLEW